MEQEKVCPSCKVVICGDIVKFSYGSPGTKAKLYARVCRYAKIPGCINDYSGEITKSDCYGE